MSPANKIESLYSNGAAPSKFCAYFVSLGKKSGVFGNLPELIRATLDLSN
ncbi:hypothetical protein F4827_006592 [Paraburkholderia bannensis]|uniref:Uncharacterized protein n=1 Tax=Paraburkholderia bannensis TaxID=765414 RepID=A0A7W9U5L8_9BURK|nr:hypothetical protein [Paraburkholderia sp. WP4_3_2]MBB6106716.1 hypothetical protein [Paraburkholderia bannensis]